MKRFTVVGLVVVVLLAIVIAPSANAQDKKRSGEDRWEFGTFLGGVLGKHIGNTNTTCNATIALSCDFDQDFTPNGISIIPPPYVDPLVDLMTSEGVIPQNGLSFGARLGVDFNSRWQGEFVYHYSSAGVRFTNDLNRLDDGLTMFCDPDSFTECDSNRDVRMVDRGGTKGNQQLYLFNINYHWNEEQRVVPYVGAGMGMERWYNGPTIALFHQRFGDDDVEFKRAGGNTAFAVDFSAGIKIHATRHFGLRLEVMNVVSFPRFDHEFKTIDLNGFIAAAPGDSLPPTGTLRQTNPMNQVIATAGIFWRF